MKKVRNLAEKLKKLIEDNQFVLYLGIFFIAYFVFLWLQSTASFLDPDSFYHLKITKLIAQGGPVLDFPWLQFTVLKEFYIDHHFLYHVLAIPFVKILGLTSAQMGDFIGFKIYTVFLATLFIFLSYCFFKKQKIKYPELFALVLLFSPALLFRISLAKATAFSLILLFLGIYLIFKRRYWLLTLVSFLYVWSYGGWLLILVMALIYVLAETIQQTFLNQPLWLKIKRFFWPAKFINYIKSFFKNLFSLDNLKIIAAVFIGNILGLVINPYFPKNLKFYWQQIVEIGIINYRGLVNVGGEWYPYPFVEIISDSGVAIIFGAVAIVLFFLLIKKQKTPSIFFFISMLVFFGLTLKSKRYVEYFVPHLVYFAAFTFTYVIEKVDLKKFFQDLKKESYIIGSLSYFILIFIAVLFPIIMVKDVYITNNSFVGGIEFERLKGASNYLLANTQPKEIIMHTDWDDFPMLFYHNSANYYIVGLDPTFMYNYDPDLYNLFADITTAKKKDNLSQEIKNTFKANYFIVEKGRAQLERNLQNDNNFIKVYEDKEAQIYKIK